MCQEHEVGGESTALVAACVSGQLSCVRALLSAKASVDLAVPPHERTALMMCCTAQKERCIAALLEVRISLQP